MIINLTKKDCKIIDTDGVSHLIYSDFLHRENQVAYNSEIALFIGVMTDDVTNLGGRKYVFGATVFADNRSPYFVETDSLHKAKEDGSGSWVESHEWLDHYFNRIAFRIASDQFQEALKDLEGFDDH